MTLTMKEETVNKMSSTSRNIAKFLIEIEAVKFNVAKPFTWTSGIKSPIYCDNRIINSRVEVRDAVISAFTNIITDKYLVATDIIAGVATGGITYGVLIADRLKLPFIYVREERKQHGLMKRVEGDYQEGDKAVLIEDHVSTGGSSVKALQGLRAEGLEVVSLLSIMTYGFKEAEERYKEQNVKHESICNLDTVLVVAQEQGVISAGDVETILEFRKSPKDWNP